MTEPRRSLAEGLAEASVLRKILSPVSGQELSMESIPAGKVGSARALSAPKARRLGHLKKKPQTPHEPGLPRMVVRLHDGGTSGKQLAEPSNETTRKFGHVFHKMKKPRGRETGASLRGNELTPKRTQPDRLPECAKQNAFSDPPFPANYFRCERKRSMLCLASATASSICGVVAYKVGRGKIGMSERVR